MQEVRTVGGIVYTSAYTYDGPGRLQAVTYPSGRIVTYAYDALGRATGIGLKRSATAPEEIVVGGGQYLPYGGLRALLFGNGLALSSSLDREHRLTGFTLADAGQQTLISRTHAHGDGWNLTAIGDNLDPAESQSLAYDAAGRLAAAAGSYGSLTWTYDLVGNRTSERRGAGPAQSYSYPPTSNRLAALLDGATPVRSFTHDAAGNLVRDERPGSDLEYVIDAAGRIGEAKVNGVSRGAYRYDGLNRLAVREERNSVPARLAGAARRRDRVIAETDGFGTVVREYIWLDEVPVAVLDGTVDPQDPELHFVHTDHLARRSC